MRQPAFKGTGTCTPKMQAWLHMGTPSLCSAACQAYKHGSMIVQLLAILHNLQCEAVPETHHAELAVGVLYMLPATRYKYIKHSSISCVVDNTIPRHSDQTAMACPSSDPVP